MSLLITGHLKRQVVRRDRPAAIVCRIIWNRPYDIARAQAGGGSHAKKQGETRAPPTGARLGVTPLT